MVEKGVLSSGGAGPGREQEAVCVGVVALKKYVERTNIS